MWKFGERVYSVLNHFEPTRTSLDLSWDNACACEQQLGNNFKFVGTDLRTIEPIGTIILLGVFRVWGQRSSGGKSWAMLIYESWRPCITRSRAAQSWCSWTISQVTFSSQNLPENSQIFIPIKFTPQMSLMILQSPGRETDLQTPPWPPFDFPATTLSQPAASCSAWCPGACRPAESGNLKRKPRMLPVLWVGNRWNRGFLVIKNMRQVPYLPLRRWEPRDCEEA